MNSPRHFVSFLLLGLFWGVSPSLYKHLSEIHLPALHTIFYSGLGVGIIMLIMAKLRGGAIDRRLVAYGFGCAALMNLPFGFNLFLAGYVPPTELAIIITMSPFFSYLVGLVTGGENASPRKLLAIFLGFLSTLVLILSREGTLSGQVSWALIASILIPLAYCAYNTFASHAWPKGADTIQAGAFESLWSGLLALPFIFFFAPFNAPGNPTLEQHWIIGAVVLMWVVERLVYFSLITTKGAVYTVQATYVSTPASVVIGALFFGGGTDIWLWVSLAVLMVALYLNNTGGHKDVLAPVNPESHPV
ncbi:DMT family transporter [Aestuariivirga litoralis]|uniref:DMT family transporter n=1 Tax=Aestuariivirga litoralis TaxID=2650924 RepID=UPI0018C5DE0B|nr:DMT family transporter [Aestuariivirga litoralis]